MLLLHRQQKVPSVLQLVELVAVFILELECSTPRLSIGSAADEEPALVQEQRCIKQSKRNVRNLEGRSCRVGSHFGGSGSSPSKSKDLHSLVKMKFRNLLMAFLTKRFSGPAYFQSFCW